MANEITGSVALQSTKAGSPAIALASGTYQIDQASSPSVDVTRTLSTASVQIALNTVTTVGMVAVQNYDTTAAWDALVSWDNSNFNIRCPAEASILVAAPAGTSAMYMKSASGTPAVRALILNA